MKRLPFNLTLSILLLLGQSAAADAAANAAHGRQRATAGAAPAAELVRRLTSTALNREARARAEAELKGMDAEPVLLALVPEAIKGGTARYALWPDSDSADGQNRRPPEEEIANAVQRLWQHHFLKSLRAGGSPPTSVGRRLVEYLSATPSALSASWLLYELGASGRSQSFWPDEAEQPVAALFRSAETDEQLRALAARCLLRNTGRKYYGEIMAVTRAYPEGTELQRHFKAERLRDIIEADVRGRSSETDQHPLDSELLNTAFALLPKLEETREGSGYSLALDLGTYVGHEFKADQKDEKYKGKHGLTPSFFADTTRNALAWWERNRHMYI